MTSSFSVYVHVPFCSVKCPYCDFNTYAVKSIPEEDYVQALVDELLFYLQQERWQGHRLTSVYFGGGTPSMFKAASFEKLLSQLHAHTNVSENLEVSVEVNPGEADRKTLAAYKSVGINRLSFGAQSLIADNLKFLGRRHTQGEVCRTLELARSLGFDSCNLDLMYGLPEQTLELLSKDLDRFLVLNPEHISAYTLTIEEGTPFYQRQQKGLLTMPSDELVADMMELVSDRLRHAGLHRYEVSNFAKTGHESKHNLGYWNYENYLGLGAGAHSFLRTGSRHCRWANVAKPALYMNLVKEKHSAQAWLERLSEQDAIFEFFFLGLRKVQGIRFSEFKRLFSKSVMDLYSTLVTILVAEGFLVKDDEGLRLSARGLLVADSVIANFADPDTKGPQHGPQADPQQVSMQSQGANQHAKLINSPGLQLPPSERAN